MVHFLLFIDIGITYYNDAYDMLVYLNTYLHHHFAINLQIPQMFCHTQEQKTATQGKCT